MIYWFAVITHIPKCPPYINKMLPVLHTENMIHSKRTGGRSLIETVLFIGNCLTPHIGSSDLNEVAERVCNPAAGRQGKSAHRLLSGNSNACNWRTRDWYADGIYLMLSAKIKQCRSPVTFTPGSAFSHKLTLKVGFLTNRRSRLARPPSDNVGIYLLTHRNIYL